MNNEGNALDFVKVECKQTCLQDAMVFVTQAKAASEAAANVMRVVFPEAEDNKDYLKVSKPLLDATTLLVDVLENMQELILNIEKSEEGGKLANNDFAARLEEASDGVATFDSGVYSAQNTYDTMDDAGWMNEYPDENNFDEDYKPDTKIKLEKGIGSSGLPALPKMKRKKKLKMKTKVKKDKDKSKLEPKEHDPINEGWGDVELKCDRCKFTTFNRIYFEDHKNGTFNYIKCPFCGLVVNKREQLGNHVAKEHNMTGLTGYQCDICPKLFKLRRLYALRWHKETDHEGISYHCQQCDHNSKSPLRLQHHQQAKHDGIQFMCDKCQYKTRYKRNLTSHIKNVHSGLPRVVKEKTYNICDICGRSVTAKVHSKCLTKQRESNGQAILCTVPGCDFTTFSAFSLKHHLEEHKGETHMCDQCNYTTTHKTNLVVHIKTVHKERKVMKCNMCDFTTKSHQYMWKHKKVTHSGPIVMLNCHEADCNFECMFPSDLRRHHDKVHKGIRWTCDLCDFSAGYKGDLNRHVKIVHQDYKVSCELCDYTTPKRYYLKEHMVKTHGIDLKKEQPELCETPKSQISQPSPLAHHQNLTHNFSHNLAQNLTQNFTQNLGQNLGMPKHPYGINPFQHMKFFRKLFVIPLNIVK